jgi:hypothetical protein
MFGGCEPSSQFVRGNSVDFSECMCNLTVGMLFVVWLFRGRMHCCKYTALGC